MATGSDSSRGELLGGLVVSAVFIAIGIGIVVEAVGLTETFMVVVGALLATVWLIKGLHTVYLLRRSSVGGRWDPEV